MVKLYTAIGKFERRMGNGGHHPVILVGGEEYMVDIPEMLIWTCCSWKILNFDELNEAYSLMAHSAGISGQADLEGYIRRLLQRGVIVSGSGENGREALHDLLASLQVLPVSASLLSKAVTFLKFVMQYRMPFGQAKEVFRRETLSGAEKRLIDLVRQAQLSTAELMKCVELGVYDVSNGIKIMEALYDDDYTTSDNIEFYAKLFKHRVPVLETVANLYLRKVIFFERV